MDVNRAKALLERYQQGQCTPEERGLVESVFDMVVDPSTQNPEESVLYSYRDEIWQALAQKLPLEIHHEPSRTLMFRRWLSSKAVLRAVAAAAAIVIFFAVGYLLMESGVERQASGLVAAEITPGGNRATLTLADGRTIDLSSEQAGIVIGVEGITYTDGSALDVIPSGGRVEGLRGAEESQPNSRDPMLRQPAHGTNSALPPASQSAPLRSTRGDVPVMLALSTPKGGTYQITLPDGSKVWLNANSTLKYPSRFPGDSREVILEGEAYFAITELQGTRDTRAPANNVKSLAGARVSRVPFLVKTDNQTVEVLGTEFNISAYQDDPETKTTLVEGKVKVSHLTSQISRLISPGEQSVSRGATIEVQQVDVAAYTAWREGDFYFSGASLQSIMKQIARWYDVEVIYEGQVPAAEFGGIIPRSRSITEVLEALEATKAVRFRIEGRRITVMT